MVTRSDFAAFDCDALVEHLTSVLKEEVTSETLDELRRNKITGKAFLELDNDDLREVTSLIGERKALKRVATSYQAPASTSVGRSPAAGHRCDAGSSMLLQNFVLPQKFSPRTMDSISTGVVVRSSKIEIISTIAMCIFQHTNYPTSEEYNAVCSQLILKYPALRDESTCGYGSWKLALRQKMKNIRRPPKAHDKKNQEPVNDDDSVPVDEPPRKKSRVSNKQKTQQVPDEVIDDAEYDEKLKMIAEESKKNRTTKVHRELMTSTYSRRKVWVEEYSPPVQCILESFPLLKKPKYLWRDFMMTMKCTHDFTEDPTDDCKLKWLQLLPKVEQLAIKESETRPAIKTLLERQAEELDQYKDSEMIVTEIQSIHCLEMIEHLLVSRTKVRIVQRFQSSVDIDEEVSKNQYNMPYIALVFGDSDVQMYPVVERIILNKAVDFFGVMQALLASYFVFNIEYPKSIRPTLIFIQFEIFPFRDSQPVPNCITQFKTVISKL